MHASPLSYLFHDVDTDPYEVIAEFSEPISNVVLTPLGPWKCGSVPGTFTVYTASGGSQTFPMPGADESHCYEVVYIYPGQECSDYYIIGNAIPQAVAIGVPDIVRVVIRQQSPLHFTEYSYRNDGHCGFIETASDVRATTQYILAFREFPRNFEVRIRSVDGSMDVRPAGTGGSSTLDLQVGVYDEAGRPVPNRSVRLFLYEQEGTAGHLHVGGKPFGSVSPNLVTTGASGVVTVQYRAPAPSGPVIMAGESEGARTAQETIEVRVIGLIPLEGGGNYMFVGDPSGHENRFNGVPGFVGAIEALADSLAIFAARIPTLPTAERPTGVFPSSLGVNDLSLGDGGLFDYKQTWAPPHENHRVGDDADIHLPTGTTWDDYADFVRLIWEVKMGHQAGDERVKANHFHLHY
jgi:hypothetical protein